MSRTGHLRPQRSSVDVDRRRPADAVSCEEFGYGLGPPTGMLVLRYRTAGRLEFGECREDLVHQLFWAPAGVLWVQDGQQSRFLGPGDGFWAARASTHRVRASATAEVFRVCLREEPPALAGRHSTPVSVPAEAAAAIRSTARPGVPVEAGLSARGVVMATLRPWPEQPGPAPTGHSAGDGQGQGQGQGRGSGYALTVARALAADPADATTLDDWAGRLHVGVKTLQRDFTREFGLPYSRWRQQARLSAARALLADHTVSEVARLVGYASASAFVAAYTREFGHTPGEESTRAG